MEECISGDIVRTFKTKMTDAFNELTEESIKTIFQLLPEDLKEQYILDWKTNLKDSSDESLVVKIADDISGIIYCVEEINMGNKYFVSIMRSYLRGLKIQMQLLQLDELYTSLESAINNNNTILQSNE